MKIAICLSGQFRTYDKCFQHVMLLKSKVESNINNTVDIFCHAWDFESPSRPIIRTHPTKTYTVSEVENILKVYRPQKFIIENYDINKKANLDVEAIAKQQFSHNSGVPITWCANQFYAIKKACDLKKQYEEEENFQYDVCIRLRYDQYIPKPQVEKLISLLDNIKSETVYTIHERKLEVYPYAAVGDVFWFANSNTFNKISEFYDVLPSIDLGLFVEQHLIPEAVLFHYLKSLGIKYEPTDLRIQICKDQEFLNRKLELGLGDLGDHEVLYEKIKIITDLETSVV